MTKGLQGTEREYRALLLNSLLSLVSEARVTVASRREDGSETVALRPFLDVRLQVWMRELRRMVASVGHEPALRFADDLNEHLRDDSMQQYLASHPEKELLAYVQSESAKWSAHIVPEEADKYVMLAVWNMVNCLAFVVLPESKATTPQGHTG